MDPDKYFKLHDSVTKERARTMLWMLIALVMAVMFLLTSIRLFSIEMQTLKDTVKRIQLDAGRSKCVSLIEDMAMEEERREREEIRRFVEELTKNSP